MDNTTLKAQIDSQITNETTPSGITPTDVGTNLKSVVDYIDQQSPIKTIGTIEIDNVSPYQLLSYDLNKIITSGATDKVVLPTTTVIGKEVLVFAMNNGASFAVRANQAGGALLSPNGVSSLTTSISVAANISYRFIHLGDSYWKSELI